MNLDEYESVGSRWITVYVNGDNITYFELNIFQKKLIGNKKITANIYRIHTYDSIMCR